jgi:hypothetical protein
VTDLHDEIRTRLKRRQGRARIVAEVLADRNYDHLTPAQVHAACDEVEDEPATPISAMDAIIIGEHDTTESLGSRAADYLRRRRCPVVNQGALRWTMPDYSASIADTMGLAWRDAWQRVPWHDGKRVVKRAPPVDAVALSDLMASSPVVTSGAAGLTAAGWVQSRGLHGDYYCVETVPPATATDPEDELMSLFKDFPLSDADARRRVLSAMITAVSMMAINGPIPAYLISAHNPGDGKTLLARIISVVADGTERVVPWHDDEDRTRELLLTALDSPARVIILDNVRGRLGGSILETMLTATTIVGARKYERAREYSMKRLIIITGNDPRLTPDMARRVVRIQVDRGGELPPADLPDVLAAALEDRPRWLACLRSLVARRGAPRPIHGCRSYEAWAGLIGGILGTDWTPIDAARVAAEHDPEAILWMPILEAMSGRAPMGAGDALAATGKTMWEELMKGRKGTPEVVVGGLLTSIVGRSIGGYRLTKEDVQVYTPDGYKTRHKYKVIGNAETVDNQGDSDDDTPF